MVVEALTTGFHVVLVCVVFFQKVGFDRICCIAQKLCVSTIYICADCMCGDGGAIKETFVTKFGLHGTFLCVQR